MNSDTKTCPYCFEEIKAEANKCRWCQSNLSGTAVRLDDWYRDVPGRRFLGVASALGQRTGISAMAWRIGFIVLTFVHGIGVLAYLAIWALTPFRRGGRAPVERLYRASKEAVRTIRTDETTEPIDQSRR